MICFIFIKIEFLWLKIDFLGVKHIFPDFRAKTSHCHHCVDLAESFRTAASPSQTDIWGPRYGQKRDLLPRELLYSYVGTDLSNGDSDSGGTS